MWGGLEDVPGRGILVCGAAVAAVCMPAAALAQERDFDIPAQPANRAVVQFAQQAGIQIVAPGSRLRGIRTRAVKGRLQIRAALNAMLAGTDIRIIAVGTDAITLGIAAGSPGRGARPEGPAAAERAGGRAAMASGVDPRADAPAQAPAHDIVVTGTRLKTDGYRSPVPLTVIEGALVRHLGQTNAADLVHIIPQTIATQSDATAGNGFSVDIGAAYANLRGLNPTYGTRTLLLLNSRRFVPSSTGGQVDLNLIPSILIRRVETVTGGASAAYGSDAVAGVVNIMLDDALQGFRGMVDHGQTGRGDGASVHAAAAYGADFAGGRGHLTLGGEYQRNRGISDCARTRSWCAESWGVFVNAAGIEPGTLNAPGNVSGYDVPGSFGYGQPNYIIGPRSGTIYMSPYGVIRNFTREAGSSATSFSNIYPAINPPLAAVDKRFTADGRAVVDYDPGAFGPRHVGGQAQGGDNLSAYADQVVQTPLERYTAYAAATFDLGEALGLSAELLYADRRSSAASTVSATRSTMAIKPDNAYLPPTLAALLGGAAFSLGKDVDAELPNVHRVDLQVFRGLVGLRGQLPGGWSWDAYYQYGVSARQSRVPYARHNDSFVMAIDAVRDPDDPDRIICRPLAQETLARFTPAYQAELRALNAACVPLNLFGIGNMSPAAIDFVWHPVGEDFTYRQHVLAGSVQGRLSDGWGAGPVGMAAGIEYRAEQGRVTHGGVNPNAYSGAFGLDYAGRIGVLESFVETSVPLLRDSAAGDYLELDGALRLTRNRSRDMLLERARSVSAISWKLGAIYDLFGGLRLRATQSRDIRAAGFRELFQKTAPTDEGTVQGRVDNPNIQGPDKADPTPIYTGGNFTLSPEKADTTTIGAVLSPAFAPGFQMSLDWYRIRLKDAIAILNGQRVTDLCVLYDLLCDRVSFAAPTDIVRIDAGHANVGRIEIRGFDFEASWRLAMARLLPALDGTLDLRILLNHQYDFQVRQDPAVPMIDYAGQTGPTLEGGDFYPTPQWMWNALVGYDVGRFNAMVTVRHVGRGVLNREWIGPDDAGYDPALPNSVNINRVPARTYVDLALSYRIPLAPDGGQHVELFGAIENLFDTRPPVAPGGTTTVLVSAYPTNPVFFDTFGFRWRAGLRVRF